MAQGYGGIMSLTGEPDGPPMKVGVGIADVMCGMYATIGILAALRHRDATGEGQHIDLALVDAQMAWLINEGVNYLTSGELPQRRGNAHPNIVPYDAFACATAMSCWRWAMTRSSPVLRCARASRIWPTIRVLPPTSAGSKTASA